MIVIRFVQYDDLAGIAISAMSYGHWATHVDAVMPDGDWVGAHVVGGVTRHKPDYDRASRVQQKFVALPCDDWTAAKFYNFIEAQIGKPYDLTAIAGFVAHRDWSNDAHWFCSELPAKGLIVCSMLAPVAARLSKITPRDLILILSGINSGINELENVPSWTKVPLVPVI